MMLRPFRHGRTVQACSTFDDGRVSGLPGIHVLMTVDAVGGVWRYAMVLAKWLRDAEVTVTFACFGPPPGPDQAAEAGRLGRLLCVEQPLDWTVEDESALLATAATIRRLAEDCGADVLHLNQPSQACSLDAPIPVLVVSHSCIVTWWRTMRSDPLPDHWKWHLVRNRQGMVRADVVLAPSYSHAAAVARAYGPQAGPHVVYNSSDLPAAGGPKDAFVFAAARWWDEAKNAPCLDRAAAKAEWPVVAAGPLAGPNGQRAAMPHVDHRGELPHEAVVRLARSAAVVASPSLYEPFGLAALEGARSGAALALSDIPTYRELWGDAALYFDPRDGDALAATLDRLAADPGLRREMAERALQCSGRFEPRRQAEEMASLYEEMIAGASRTGVSV